MVDVASCFWYIRGIKGESTRQGFGVKPSKFDYRPFLLCNLMWIKSISLAFTFSTKFRQHRRPALHSLHTSLKSSVNLQGQAPFFHSKYLCEYRDQRPLGFPDTSHNKYFSENSWTTFLSCSPNIWNTLFLI
jgi:hypothetical protein